MTVRQITDELRQNTLHALNYSEHEKLYLVRRLLYFASPRLIGSSIKYGRLHIKSSARFRIMTPGS